MRPSLRLYARSQKKAMIATGVIARITRTISIGVTANCLTSFKVRLISFLRNHYWHLLPVGATLISFIKPEASRQKNFWDEGKLA